MERDISGGRGKIPVIVAAAVALASLISLIPGCLREFLCLLLQQLIQRFFHTAVDQFLYLTLDRKSTRLNSSHVSTSYAVFCLKKPSFHTVLLHDLRPTWSNTLSLHDALPIYLRR